MIERSQIDTTFIQSGGSCVLASYAVINKYFTSQPIEETFQDYCRHFNLSFANWREAEQKYAHHFDQEWKRRGCRGYQVILDLHNSSSTTSFELGRSAFDANFYLDSSANLAGLQKILQSQEALLNISFQDSGTDYHSVTVFATSSTLVVRDTNRRGLSEISSLTGLGNLRDSILYNSKAPFSGSSP